MPKILIVYYSRKGENYWNGGVKSLKKGNTEIVAELIQKAVGGDLFEVETVKEYAQNYRDCCNEAQRELKENARPALKRYPAALDEYDVIFVGYPNWWGTMPMAMFTLLEKYDLKGKKNHTVLHQRGQRHGFERTRSCKTLQGRNRHARSFRSRYGGGCIPKSSCRMGKKNV